MTSLGTDLAADDMLYDPSREEEERKHMDHGIPAPKLLNAEFQKKKKMMVETFILRTRFKDTRDYKVL